MNFKKIFESKSKDFYMRIYKPVDATFAMDDYKRLE
jgi:hypothetical protein